MKCCICNNEIEGYPNNAEPIKSGQCCTNCNLEIVIPNRLKHMNALRKAAIAQATFEKGMKELNGYEVQTTFYQDFTIADAFGVDAVEDTYKRAFNEWKTNKVYVTELSLVLNHKIWEHHHKQNHALMITYDTLWKKHDEWCMTALSDEDVAYYLRITD